MFGRAHALWAQVGGYASNLMMDAEHFEAYKNGGSGPGGAEVVSSSAYVDPSVWLGFGSLGLYETDGSGSRPQARTQVRGEREH